MTRLLGMFTGTTIPAVGISLGIDRLVAALGARGETEKVSSAQVLVMSMPGGSGRSMKTAATLRKAGIAAELYPEEARLKKQFEYGGSQGDSAGRGAWRRRVEDWGRTR